MSIDCDVQTAGLQTACDVPLGTDGIDVAVIATNTGNAGHSLGAFGFRLHDSVNSRLLPRPGVGVILDGNPDFNNALTAGWDCNPVVPDTGEDGGSSAVSLLSCYLTGDYEHQPVLAGGESIVLATVHYQIPALATPGSTELRLGFASIYGGEPQFDELGSCDPEIFVPIPCPVATVHLFGIAPSPTATARAATPSPRPATPTPRLTTPTPRATTPTPRAITRTRVAVTPTPTRARN